MGEIYIINGRKNKKNNGISNDTCSAVSSRLSTETISKVFPPELVKCGGPGRTVISDMITCIGTSNATHLFANIAIITVSALMM